MAPVILALTTHRLRPTSATEHVDRPDTSSRYNGASSINRIIGRRVAVNDRIITGRNVFMEPTRRGKHGSNGRVERRVSNQK